MLKEKCGVFGCFNIDNSSLVNYYGLHALQHRGQEGCGILGYDEKNKFILKKGLGLVSEKFRINDFKNWNTINSIGHVLYSTTGGSVDCNVQPFFFNLSKDSFGLAHNGNLTNAHIIKSKFEEEGSIFQATSDSEILAHLITKSKEETRINKIKNSLNVINGAFAFLLLFEDEMYAIRDRNGLRPLSIAKLNNGYVVSSETYAFDVTGAEFIRDVNPGEIIKITKNGLESYYFSKNNFNTVCSMEYIYFSHPSSTINDINVHNFRVKSGELLAEQENIYLGDVVIGVPDSSTSAALGYAKKSNLPFDIGLIKNKYSGRTFIQPTTELREIGVRNKLSVIKDVINNKRVILIDDSIVRGTTSKYIVKLLKDNGAKEVHLRVASPPIKYPSYYGIDISTYKELLAANMSLAEMNSYIGSDSLSFLTLDNLKKLFKPNQGCFDIFTGVYPVDIYDLNKGV
ncbi:Glutamine-fructose-6-phosphate transaminase (Isomerizing) [Spiroplasma turonicum]|uniref:Amidophosphoribosyltransferase n=2 Tax=Spiroplasma turonicum TaxID=216946 RepID=A0A0K1P7R2_9MOLU|nr:amidophosphoribosyltransferase [Spiroplasma turonicum]AKU80234.1 Glutamine-fructose-6-phosphate transaminase (Isomerizing) [Spiroplasma turonicum]ALX71234.1 amidophosphoribosyltransferase [Spiroplasma turonicum]